MYKNLHLYHPPDTQSFPVWFADRACLERNVLLFKSIETRPNIDHQAYQALFTNTGQITRLERLTAIQQPTV